MRLVPEALSIMVTGMNALLLPSRSWTGPATRRRFLGSLAGFSLAGLAVVRGVRAGEPGARERFVPLFNGRDLTGWVPVNVAPNTFTVRDGMIVSTGVPTGVMRTVRQYSNFILELDWKHIHKDGNAGLFVYSEPISAPGVPFAKAIEVQILDGDSPEGIWTGQGDVFAIHGAHMVPDRPHPRGWERCLPDERRAHPAGEWNHYRVESRDGRLTLAVNGRVVSGASQCNPRQGYICLESEGSECHFKNIRIMELPSSKVPVKERASKDVGFKSLYTGIDLAGWKAEKGHEGHWVAKDWTLSCDGQGTRELWRQGKWHDFELICDWRMEKTGGLAGILFRGDPASEVLLARDSADWHRTVVRVVGKKLRVETHGKTTATLQRDLAKSSSGPVGLKHHGAPVEFASLYIRKL